MVHYEHSGLTPVQRRIQGAFDNLISRYTNARGFNYLAEVDQIDGPVVELAGPTPDGFRIIGDVLPVQPLVCNVRDDTDILGGSLDVIADARKLPFRNRTVGMVLMSGLPFVTNDINGLPAHLYDKFAQRAHAEYEGYTGPREQGRLNQRIKLIEEASRVLIDGGMLVWQDGHMSELAVAAVNGLEPKRWQLSYTEMMDGTSSSTFECVFQKTGAQALAA